MFCNWIFLCRHFLVEGAGFFCFVIGSDKLRTLSVYQLVDGEYEVGQFRGSDGVVLGVFPELNLRAEQIFGASL